MMLVATVMTSAVFGAVSEQEMQDSRQQNYMQSLIMIGAMILFFYFILLRPEQKRRKKLEQQRNSLQQGSKVTAMGIVGVVDKIEEKTIILKMVDGSKIEVLKGAITDVEPSQAAPS